MQFLEVCNRFLGDVVVPKEFCEFMETLPIVLAHKGEPLLIDLDCWFSISLSEINLNHNILFKFCESIMFPKISWVNHDFPPCFTMCSACSTMFSPTFPMFSPCIPMFHHVFTMFSPYSTMFSTSFPMFPHGFPMVFPWFRYGFRGFPMDPPLTLRRCGSATSCPAWARKLAAAERMALLTKFQSLGCKHASYDMIYIYIYIFICVYLSIYV